MSKNTKLTADQLAAAGVYVETPQIEVKDDQPMVEPVGMDKDFSQMVADEAFLNEHVVIRLATTTDENAPQFARVCVNDVSNGVDIPRGVPFRVKRMHVEVLARMRETKYTQPQRNPMDPESGNLLIPRHAQVYPFEVLQDTDRGRAWYARLMAEPTY